MVAVAVTPRRSYKEQMEDRIPRFVQGRCNSLILNPSSSVSTNHRTTKASNSPRVTHSGQGSVQEWIFFHKGPWKEHSCNLM